MRPLLIQFLLEWKAVFLLVVSAGLLVVSGPALICSLRANIALLSLTAQSTYTVWEPPKSLEGPRIQQSLETPVRAANQEKMSFCGAAQARVEATEAMVAGNAEQAHNRFLALSQAGRLRPIERIFWGKILFARGREDQAVALLDSKGTSRYFCWLGDLSLKTGSAVLALELSQMSLRIQESAEGYVLEGRALDKLGNAPGALQAFERGARLAPKGSKVQSDLAFALLDHRGDVPSVRSLLNRALANDPGNPDLKLGLASVMLPGEPAHALSLYEDVKAIDPQNIYAYLGIGDASMRLGDFDRAKKAVETALELNPNHANARWQMGRYYEALEMHAEALREFQQADRLQPGKVEYLVSLGEVYLALHDDARAMIVLSLALDLRPGDPHISRQLASIKCREQ